MTIEARRQVQESPDAGLTALGRALAELALSWLDDQVPEQNAARPRASDQAERGRARGKDSSNGCSTPP
jgi:hypothetical protein